MYSSFMAQATAGRSKGYQAWLKHLDAQHIKQYHKKGAQCPMGALCTISIRHVATYHNRFGFCRQVLSSHCPFSEKRAERASKT